MKWKVTWISVQIKKRSTPDKVKLMKLLMRKMLNCEYNYGYQRISISVERKKELMCNYLIILNN